MVSVKSSRSILVLKFRTLFSLQSNPDIVAMAYTENTEWRNRGEFLSGREEIREVGATIAWLNFGLKPLLQQFLRRKWSKEKHYRLKKYLWLYGGNRISVCFEYEYLDEAFNQWYRAYGNENWEFDEYGYMRKRIASINEAPIKDSERRISVDEGAIIPENTWLFHQGVSVNSFPFGGGSHETYNVSGTEETPTSQDNPPK